MYSTCLFCNRPLGENAVIEEFPVGRRLAFDAAKGRLWVVCRKCERWNLSPLEERWEAIEAAERLFGGTRMRVSTEHIGLARHPEGLELVRIGKPQRPEFAAWRYGDQFGRRRRRAFLIGGAAIAVVGTVATAGVVTGAISAGLLGQSGNFINLWMNGRTLLTVRTPEGKTLKLKRPHLGKAAIRQNDDDTWSIVMSVAKKEHTFSGPEAERVAGLIMPKLNSGGAGVKSVQDAVRHIELAGGPQEYLQRIVVDPPRKAGTLRYYKDHGQLGAFPTHARLALEMALHEEQERRALEGELATLEAAWKSAEEIAAISDDLLLPESVRQFVEEKKGE
jgi:hypothetical protein